MQTREEDEAYHRKMATFFMTSKDPGAKQEHWNTKARGSEVLAKMQDTREENNR